MTTRRKVRLPDGFFSPESTSLLDESEKTQQLYVEAIRERSRQDAESRQAADAVAAATFAESQEAFVLSGGELRERLTDAITRYDAALHRVGIAQGVLDRAEQRMAEADAELKDYASLDQQIADWHVDQIRRDVLEQLPVTLADAQADRGRIIDKLDAHHKAHAKLEEELKTAQRHLDECTAHRSRCASQVIAKFMDSIATELNTAIDRVIALRRDLVSAGSVWVSSPLAATPLPLSAHARQAIFRQVDDVQPDQTYIESLRRWHMRLLNDPQASLEEDSNR